MNILVGDIGGTNIRLATFDGREIGDLMVSENRGQVAVESALQSFKEQFGPFDAVGLGVAGPVCNGQIQMTNVCVALIEDRLEKMFRCPVRLMNDFEAQALAIEHIPEEFLVPLGNVAQRMSGHRVVLGAGTGLGEATLIREGSRFIAVPGEGSHGRFSPKSEQEIDLLRWLMQRWPDHVSVERVVSGPGLVNIYDFLRGDNAPHPDMANEDPAAVITRRGLDGTCPICVDVLRLFIETLADEAATFALKCNASAVYLSGGIPPRILARLHTEFRPAFENKGRYSGLMSNTAVYVVTYPNAGLLGAGMGVQSLVSDQ